MFQAVSNVGGYYIPGCAISIPTLTDPQASSYRNTRSGLSDLPSLCLSLDSIRDGMRYLIVGYEVQDCARLYPTRLTMQQCTDFHKVLKAPSFPSRMPFPGRREARSALPVAERLKCFGSYQRVITPDLGLSASLFAVSAFFFANTFNTRWVAWEDKSRDSSNLFASCANHQYL
jgi:hypothetical protein